MAKRDVTVAKGDKLVLNFTHETETKNMERFSEDIEDWSKHVVGKFYLHKAAFVALGEPSHITLTITKPGK